MQRSCFYILFLSFFLTSCGWFTTGQPEDIIARVQENYLLRSDLIKELPLGLSKEDSARFASSFINDWATKQLLVQGALRNLSEEEQDKFDYLIQGYRTDLYTKSYMDALIAKTLDSVVSDTEASEFYEKNKENFNLNEPLLKLRYIHIGEDYYNVDRVKDHFISYKEEDKYALDSLSLQFKSYFLNDSIWVKRSQVQSKINPINLDNADNLLKKTNFLQLRDSLGLYLVAVKGTLSRNETAPLEYVRNTINQIIINKRKLELVKRLEKEIKEDAIKDKRFEIYN